jgi:hypothetical protein
MKGKEEVETKNEGKEGSRKEVERKKKGEEGSRKEE